MLSKATAPRRRPGWICTVTRLSAGAARRKLARRVVDQGWTLAAAEAAGVSVRCARKWVGRYRAGDRQLLDRSSAPRRVANRTCPERVAVIVKLRRLRMTAAEIAETLAMPLSTVAGILTRVGMGWLGRLGLEQPARDERSRPGEPCTSTSRSSAGSSAAPASAGATASTSTTPAATPMRPAAAAEPSAGSSSTSLRRGAPGREGDDGDRLPPSRCRLLPPLRHSGRAAAHR